MKITHDTYYVLSTCKLYNLFQYYNAIKLDFKMSVCKVLSKENKIKNV